MLTKSRTLANVYELINLEYDETLIINVFPGSEWVVGLFMVLLFYIFRPLGQDFIVRFAQILNVEIVRWPESIKLEVRFSTFQHLNVDKYQCFVNLKANESIMMIFERTYKIGISSICKIMMSKWIETKESGNFIITKKTYINHVFFQNLWKWHDKSVPFFYLHVHLFSDLRVGRP